MKHIVTVLTATALMVALMAATAAPAFAVGYHHGTCEKHCEVYAAGKSNPKVEKENELWGWGSNNEQFPHETKY